MQAQEYLANFYCSEEFNQGLDNKKISLSAINILLGITAIIGNTVILIALCKETSLHKPSKVLLRNLVSSDLCVGFVQLVFGAREISILQGRWQTCRHLYMVIYGRGYSSQHFDNSIIIYNNRHKRRQTFGSVDKTQVQTGGNRYKSLRYCYSFLDF